jgi:hypothetical protein
LPIVHFCPVFKLLPLKLQGFSQNFKIVPSLAVEKPDMPKGILPSQAVPGRLSATAKRIKKKDRGQYNPLAINVARNLMNYNLGRPKGWPVDGSSQPKGARWLALSLFLPAFGRGEFGKARLRGRGL